MGKREEAMEYQRAHPRASISQVCAAVGCCKATVHYARKQIGYQAPSTGNEHVNALKAQREERLRQVQDLLGQQVLHLPYAQTIEAMKEAGVTIYPRDVLEVKRRLKVATSPVTPGLTDRGKLLTLKW